MKLFFVIIGLLMPVAAGAQIAGRVIDDASGAAVVGAAVSLFANDSVMCGGVMTDAAGGFSISADGTEVRIIRVSCMGYQTLTLRSGEPFGGDVGTVRLEADARRIDEVVVTGSRSRNDATKERIVITESLRKSAANTAQMLGRIPGIRTDIATEEIKIGKDTDVPVVVNGREVGKDYALSLSPKRVKSVEILRYPAGKYSDYPILLNIELFDDYSGWDVAAYGRGMVSPDHGNSNGESAGGSLTLTAGKWNVYATAGYTHRRMKNATGYEYELEGTHSERTETADPDNPNVTNTADNGKFSIGTDYHVGKNHWLSAQTWIEKAQTDSRENTTVLFDNETRDVQTRTNKYNTLNSATGLFYRGAAGRRLQVEADVIYNYYHINDNHSFNALRSGSSYSYCGRKDYVRTDLSSEYTFTDALTASLNYTFTWRGYDNKSRTDGNEIYSSAERRHQVYASMAYRPVDKMQLRAGLTMLNVGENNTDGRRNNTSWMPRAQFYYEPTGNLKLNWTYFCSVDYPNLDYLSSVKWQVNSLLWKVGQPGLKARVMHYSQLEVTLFRILRLTYLWKHSKNDITDWYEMADGGTAVLQSYVNCNYNHNYLGLYFDKDFKHGIRTTLNVNYQWYKRYLGSGEAHNGHTSYYDMEVSWSVPQTRLTLTGSYFLRADYIPLLQGKQYGEEESLRFSVGYSFLKGRMPVSLSVKVPTAAVSKQAYTRTELPRFTMKTVEDDRVMGCLINLNIRYNIGNGKAKMLSNSPELDREK